MTPIDFEGDLIQAVLVLSQLAVDGVAAVGALAVLSFQLLYHLGALSHFFGEDIQLGIDLGTLELELGELAGQHHAQLDPHLIAQPGIALGLCGLTLE